MRRPDPANAEALRRWTVGPLRLPSIAPCNIHGYAVFRRPMLVLRDRPLDRVPVGHQTGIRTTSPSPGAAMTDLTVAIADGVALLTLNRPERRNAYTAQVGELLNGAYRQCDDDDAVRAIVLTGAGDAFCVGADFSTAASPFAA